MFCRIAGGAMLLVALSCLDTVEQVGSLASEPGTILQPTGRAATPGVAAALHLHGWSNHGGNSRPASIAWHTQQYAAAGVDLIWWTEHSDAYFGRVPDLNITPVTPTAVLPGVWSLGVWGPGGQGRAFLRSIVAPAVDSAAGRVRVDLTSGAAARADTVELFFGELRAGYPRPAAFGILARPLVGRPRFSMTVGSLGRSEYFPEIAVLVPLAWHPRAGGGYRQVLRYQFGSQDSSTAVLGDTIVLKRILSGTDSAVIELEPTLDASVFPDGLDNTTDEYRIRFVVRRSAVGGRLSFSLPKVANAVSTAAQMTPAIDLAHATARAQGVRAMWGMELPSGAGPIFGTKWYAVSGAGRHLTMFLPEDLSPALEGSLSGTASRLAVVAQSLGGITAIAHPFGTSSAPPVGTELEEREEARQLGAFLVQNGAWEASLIEVGTIGRGLVGIRGHLYLLDYLWASGLRICGTGVTDAHGGYLLRDPVPGTDQYNFVTWIGGVNRLATGPELVAAIRSCDVSFGDPFYTRGGIWVRVRPDSSGKQFVSFDTNGLSPSAGLFLYEAEIDSTGVGHDPVYRRAHQPVGRSDRPEVGGCRAGFVRLEAWVGERPLTFSNVAVVAADPSRCASGMSSR